MLRVEARVEALRSRLIETSALITDDAGVICVAGAGKYVPGPHEQNDKLVATLVASQGQPTLQSLREGARPSA